MEKDPYGFHEHVRGYISMRCVGEKETTKRVGENGTDKLLINTLMWMDKHSIMPKFIIDLSPFHTSLFVTNLKSLGINHVFHHVYNFGTTGLFFAMSLRQMRKILRNPAVLETPLEKKVEDVL